MPAKGGVNDMATDIVVDRPPPSHLFEQVMLAAAEDNRDRQLPNSVGICQRGGGSFCGEFGMCL